MNVHPSSKEKSDDSKDDFYKELEQVFDNEILLGDFNAKARRENILKPTMGNNSLYQDRNDNGVRIVNFANLKKIS